MSSTYLDIMIQSLEEKQKALEEIKRINCIQKELLEKEKSDADAFDKTVEDKAAYIEKLELLDSGFDKLFERVKQELGKNKEIYKSQIAIMQTLIRQITDCSIEIQAQEVRNKELMTKKFVSVRERAKTVRTNGKAASQYYKNMMQLNYIPPQFLDNKK